MESRSQSRRGRPLGEAEKRALVSRQAESGKTLAAFCRDEGLALSSFQDWRKRFSGRPGFLEIAAPVRPGPVPVEFILTSGGRIATSSDCDPVWLAKLVRALGEPPC